MNTSENITLAAIVGPTGVGKTAAAVDIAGQLGMELLSVDSRQIYIGMDIATGKEVDQGQWRSKDNRLVLEINGVPIHGLNLVHPNEPFSVSDWYEYASTLIDEAYSSGRKLLLVGGTGFYLSALEGKIATMSIPPNAQLRAQLEEMSTSRLVEELHSVNPDLVTTIDTHNRRRLVRAIEVAKSRSKDQLNPRQFDLALFGLTMDRKQLYEKIDRRIEHMVQQGLVEETQRLLRAYDASIPAMSGIGYAEMIEYLEGNYGLDEAIQRIKWRNHRYVRRQYTWFKKQPIQWFDVDSGPEWKDHLMDYVSAVVS